MIEKCGRLLEQSLSCRDCRERAQKIQKSHSSHHTQFPPQQNCIYIIMPPKKKSKTGNDSNKTEAQNAVLEDEEIIRERQLSMQIYQSALTSRIVSSTLPSTAEVIQTRKTQLFKSDAKDIAKKANTRKSRHMVVFPGQFAQFSLNARGNNANNNNNNNNDNNNNNNNNTNNNAVEFGELADLDTQNPVCYINFPDGIGRMKLYGTIARARESRYFTLNLGGGGGGSSSRKDSGGNANANLEDFFDGVLIFSQWAWIGTKEENPEEKPLLEIPESVWKTMNSGNKKTAIDWERKNNAGAGKKKKGGEGGKKGDENEDTNTADDSVITLGDSDEDEGEGKDKKQKDASGGRRPKRQAAAKAEKNLADNDGLGNIDFDGDDDSDSDDGSMKSPQALVRGKATISIISPIQPSIAGREVSLRSPGGGGDGNSKKKSSADKAAAAKKKAQQQKKKKREERIELSDSDDSDDVMDLISSDESSEDDEPIAKKARPARRSSAAATKTYKEDSDSDEDGDGDDDEEEESDFDDDDDDDSDFE